MRVDELLFVSVAAASILMSGCSISAASSQEPEKPATALRSEPPPGPSIVLSINGLSASVIKEGGPLLIEAAVTTAGGRYASQPISLGAGWSGMAKLEISGKTSGPVAGLDPKAIHAGQPAIVLDGKTLGRLSWAIEGPSARKLTPGEYTVVVTLDTEKSAGAGWKGTASSRSCPLMVKAASTALTDEEAQLEALYEIRVHGALGRTAEALDACDRFLVGKPKDGLILESKADALAKAGRFAEAVAAYDAALDNVPAQERSAHSEPPVLLISKRDIAAGLAQKEKSGH